jgi:hypothetical protein
MRPPSHQRPHVHRALLLRGVLAALLAMLVLVPAAGAAPGDRGVFVSKGVGRQMFAGGGGVAYGTVFSGGSLVVMDYSPTHDLKVDSPVLATTNADGSRTFAPAGGAKSMAFRISGTLYRVTVLGSSTYNAIGVYGRLRVSGVKSSLTVNGKKVRWNGPAIKLGKVPRPLRDLFELALTGAAPPAPPAPPPPPPVTVPPTTTVTTGG